MTWLDGPIAGFDTETTSRFPEQARVVTACVGVAPVPGEWRPKLWLAACGDIPEETTEIHGVTTEYANEHGRPSLEVVTEVRDLLYAQWASGVPVVGHNLVYDFTVMDVELIRLGESPFEVAGPVLDTMVLDRETDKYRRGKRTLEATCNHYGIPTPESHSAGGDVMAAVRLMWKIATRYTLTDFTLDELTVKQAEWHAARQADFAAYLRRKGEDASQVSGEWPMRRVSV